MVSDYDLLSLDTVSGKMQVRYVFASLKLSCFSVCNLALHTLLRLSIATSLCCFVLTVLSIYVFVRFSLLMLQEAGFFPRADTNWDAFHEVQKLVLKNAGRL